MAETPQCCKTRAENKKRGARGVKSIVMRADENSAENKTSGWLKARLLHARGTLAEHDSSFSPYNTLFVIVSLTLMDGKLRRNAELL